MTFDAAQAALGGKTKRGGWDGHPAFEAPCPACRADGRDRKGVHLVVYWPASDEFFHFCRCVLGHTEAEIEYALGWTMEDRRIDGGSAHPGPVARSAAPCEPAPLPPLGPTSERPSDHGQTWTYENPNGKPALVKRKEWEWEEYRPAKKGIPERPAGWYKGFKQWAPGGGPLNKRGEKLLFRLPQVIAAVTSGRTVYVNEGEKGAEAFPPDVVATCQPNGAGTGSDGHWTEWHSDWLRGCALAVVVADRDPVGRAYARSVGASLEAIGVPCRLVHSKTQGDKDDAFDHFAAGHGVDDFVPMEEPSPDALALADGLTVWSGEDADCPPPEWIVPDYLLAGVLTLLDGKRGTTKTTMSLQWAAKLSRGVHPFEWQKDGWKKSPLPVPCGPIKTLYVHKGEDSSKKLDNVYRANGGVPGSLMFLDDPMFRLDAAGLARIRGYIEKYGFRYVVIDNLIYYLTMLCGDVGDGAKVGPHVLAIQKVATETGAAFHGMRHMKKGSSGKAQENEDISEAGLGSVLIASISRGQHVIRELKDRPGVYVLTCERGTIDTEPGPPIGWRKFGLELEYLETVDNPGDKPKDATERLSQMSKAREVIKANVGPFFNTLTTDVQRLIHDLGVSPETMRRAFKLMHVDSQKQKGVADGKFYCRIPDQFEGVDFDPWDC